MTVKNVEVEEARKNQSTMLQQSLNMKNSHEETMSIAIENIRDEHEAEVKRLKKKFQVCVATIYNKSSLFQADNKRALDNLEKKLKNSQDALLAKRDEAAKNRALMEQATSGKAKLEQDVRVTLSNQKVNAKILACTA